MCFPYTSRDEITTAIKETVTSYSKPQAPATKRSFSESHITRNLRAQHLTTVQEESESGNDSRGTSPAASSTSTAINTSVPSVADAPHPETQPPYPDPENITSETLTSYMFTAGNPPLDLLIRTSGVERLSDFMLWQCHQDTSIVFLDCLWPEFDLWQFLPVLVEWQWQRRKMEEGERGRSRLKDN